MNQDNQMSCHHPAASLACPVRDRRLHNTKSVRVDFASSVVCVTRKVYGGSLSAVFKCRLGHAREQDSPKTKQECDSYDRISSASSSNSAGSRRPAPGTPHRWLGDFCRPL